MSSNNRGTVQHPSVCSQDHGRLEGKELRALKFTLFIFWIRKLGSDKPHPGPAQTRTDAR